MMTDNDSTPGVASSSTTVTQLLANSTAYIVLKQLEGGDWSTVNTSTNFKSGEYAIRAVVAKLAAADQKGTYVAVPTRSWRPVKVTPRVETTLTLEDVKAP